MPLQINGSEDGFAVTRLAVTHNASDGGVLAVTSSRYPVGEKLSIIVGRPESEKTLKTEGRVVRSGPNEDDPTGLWPYSAAIEFVQPPPGLGDLLSTLS